MRKIELELILASEAKNHNIGGQFVITYRKNVDGRGVTKSRIGYTDGEKWFSLSDDEIEDVYMFSILPEPFDDINA